MASAAFTEDNSKKKKLRLSEETNLKKNKKQNKTLEL